MRSIDKFRGCMIGGAVGDALGYAVEFIREEHIFSRYGIDGITEYLLKNGKALISDDTQMSLFTANGLLLGHKMFMKNYLKNIRKMYLCWYRTQNESYSMQDKQLYCKLLNIPELYNRRSPGMSCLSALEYGAKGTIKHPVNDSKGCGGVMRVAPIGLYFSDKKTGYDSSDMLGAEAAALTHGHELGYIPSATFVHIVRAVTEKDIAIKEAVLDSVQSITRLFTKAEYINDFADIIQRAVTLSETENDDLIAIHQLGEGWVAEETLAIAVYCALKYENDFDKAIRAAVNHNGDSDSTGAVCGNIIGAYLGYDAIPQKYKLHLELHDLIVKTADDLYNGNETS